MTVQAGSDRVKTMQESVFKPSVCSNCGSTFFVAATAGQFNITDYGVRAVSNSPQTIYVCLCGEPFIPKNIQNMTTRGGERQGFVDSVASAKKYRANQDSSKLLANLASIDELNKIARQIDELSTRFDALIKQLTEE